jgi:hypothetical protein
MRKLLLTNLFKTFLYSTILSIACTSLFSILYFKTKHVQDVNYTKIISSIASGSLFLNLILLIMTLPALFLSYPHIWANKVLRPVFFFLGSVVFIATTLFSKLQQGDIELYLFTGILFLIVDFIFYKKFVNQFK